MRSFGTAYNHAFGETDETGILVAVKDIYPEKSERHFKSYITRNPLFMRRKLFKITRPDSPLSKIRLKKKDKKEEE